MSDATPDGPRSTTDIREEVEAELDDVQSTAREEEVERIEEREQAERDRP